MNMQIIEQYRQLHEHKHYGWESELEATKYAAIISERGVNTVLDYGSGQSRLAYMLPCEGKRYDPAIEGIDTPPEEPVDMILCTDVLEHIPDEDLDEVFANIAKLADTALFVIHLGKAKNKLPNGDNCHCTVMPEDWWFERIKGKFDDVTVIESTEMKTLILAQNKEQDNGKDKKAAD